MERILIFLQIMLFCAGTAHAAVRDASATNRGNSAQQRVTTTSRATSTGATRVTASSVPTSTARAATQTVQARAATTSAPRVNTRVSSRAATTSAASPRTTPAASQSSARVATRATQTTARNASHVVRAADTDTDISQTRTGAAYEQCKSAYFTCMDQFCTLKNDDYRRCSCSSRVYELAKARQNLVDAGQQLTVFTENLDVVGMTAAQAAAMHTASDGENALTADTSASKALLQAIMNSIRGKDTSVGGKYSDLNSINLAFTTVGAFGNMDAASAVATYDGQNLYTAVYPQCRRAVAADCNDASLQRAVNAYLMAIEQDCNTVATAIDQKRSETKAAIREGSAMLDLARVENRRNHNSDDIATCIANVETAILSEEVCGAGYHKCLDNGEFIDIATGAPIAGVVKFYELEKLLQFADGVQSADQRLSSMVVNRPFVNSFVSRTKKFAEPALDKCLEQSDVVWAEYLDKALVDIYYAQRAKVQQIKQGCFDFVSACYMNGDTSITAAMSELTGGAEIVLQPGRVALASAMCREYVQSCDNMFGGIVQQYIDTIESHDTLTACRAVVKQCFDKFGGTGFENFYYPYSGLFNRGLAPDWFTLYAEGNTNQYVSPCADELTTIDACNDPEIIQAAFGGFDKWVGSTATMTSGEIQFTPGGAANAPLHAYYGIFENDKNSNTIILKHRNLRASGVATEVYNQILDTLSTQCINIQGRFVEKQSIKENIYRSWEDPCIYTPTLATGGGDDKNNPTPFAQAYNIGNGENMCPRDYKLDVDIESWGACLCFENGARRSKWGRSVRCMDVLPVDETVNDANCRENEDLQGQTPTNSSFPTNQWCVQTLVSSSNQICSLGGSLIQSAGTDTRNCQSADGEVFNLLPEGL